MIPTRHEKMFGFIEIKMAHWVAYAENDVQSYIKTSIFPSLSHVCESI